jgi:hypothetical protein
MTEFVGNRVQVDLGVLDIFEECFALKVACRPLESPRVQFLLRTARTRGPIKRGFCFECLERLYRIASIRQPQYTRPV